MKQRNIKAVPQHLCITQDKPINTHYQNTHAIQNQPPHTHTIQNKLKKPRVHDTH